jgi:hypothetical protein
MENLRSQFATSSWGGRRKLPLVFTEHGAIMAASVPTFSSEAAALPQEMPCGEGVEGNAEQDV